MTWSDTDDNRPLQMSDNQLDKRSQVSGPASDANDRQMEDQPIKQPAAPAVIPIEVLVAITQALKLSHTGPRSEIQRGRSDAAFETD